MASIQRIFPRLNTAALSFVRKPAGALGVWDQASAVYSGPGARYVGPQAGSAQVQAVPRFNAVPGGATRALLLAQLVSDPLRAVLIPASSWSIGFAAQLANAGAAYKWQGRAALLVLSGTTGQRRATIFDTTAIGSGGRTATGELTCLDTVAEEAVQVRAGDCLVLELGIAVANTAAALAPQASLFADGTVPISADNVAVASAAAVLEAPQELLLTLPTAGEPPSPSVTQAQAVRILKDAFPPRSDSLYDWDSSDALVHKVFEALGDVIKLYGYDQSDRLFRETNPLTTCELLPFWESLLGITLSDAALRTRSADQRRQTVLARLREVGPLTDFNLAAIFAQLAGYVAPASPEVLYQLHSDMEAANTYTDPIGGAIPTGTGFDDFTNLRRLTPTLLDGGVVWDAGVLVTLNLSAVQSQNLHIRLLSPGFTSVVWSGGPNLSSTIKLRSPIYAGRPIHGNWLLNVYRDVGSPAVTLSSWSLYVLGKGWGGRASSRFIWSLFLDAAHQGVDRRDIDSTLDRITPSYAEGFVIFDKASIPGTNTHRAGRFIPGS